MGTAWLDRLANLCDEEEELERKSVILKASLLSGKKNQNASTS